jgi:hypothetical protein
MARAWIDKRKAMVSARSKFLRARLALQPAAPRIPSAGPTSAAIKVIPAELRVLIDAAMAERRPS